MVFNSTLFDENVSTHFAWGRVYSKCVPNFDELSDKELENIGFNKSKTHIDFMIGTNDLNVEADTKEGKKLIFKNSNFKTQVAEVVIKEISEIQNKYNEIINSKELDEILAHGKERTRELARLKLEEVKQKIGFYE